MHVAKHTSIHFLFYCHIPYVQLLHLRPPPNQNSNFYWLGKINTQEEKFTKNNSRIHIKIQMVLSLHFNNSARAHFETEKSMTDPSPY